MGRQVASALGGGKMLSGLLSTDDAADNDYVPISRGQRVGAMYLFSLRESEMQRLRGVDREAIPEGSAEEHYLRALPEQVATVALRNLDRSLEADPTFVPARLLRAWIHCQLGQFEAMLTDAEAILAVDETQAAAYAVRAAAHLLRGEYQAAVASAETAALGGSDYRLDVLTGLALAGAGRHDAALAALSRALALKPDSVLALQKHAELNMADGHLEVAVAHLNRVLEIEPTNVDALEMRGGCYDRLERYDAARSDYLEAYGISDRFVLLSKAYAAAANLQKRQTLAAESQDANDPEQRAPGEMEADAPPLPQPGDSTGVQDWLRKFFDGSESNSNSRTLPARSMGLHAW